MTLEMGQVHTGSSETTNANEAVATAVAQVSTQSVPSAISGDASTGAKSGLALPDLDALAKLETVAPGYAKAWLEAELARDKQRRLFRLLGLLVTMALAVFAIGFGQWTLMHGATSEALFLSGTGLLGLVGAFLGATRGN